MVKNKTEKMFSKSLKLSNLWGMKIESNPLAHQQQVGDFILTYDYTEHYTIIVEAKQVTCDEEGKGRFAFKRFKNLVPLLTFDLRNGNHKGFLLLTYNESGWADSDIYLIPVVVWENWAKDWNNVSLNRNDALAVFNPFRLDIHTGSIIDIENAIKRLI